ncbi:MAG: hypothetical protein U0835_02105 [Isosphaeraceae bacterium]
MPTRPFEPVARYYELPYRLARRAGKVAVVGAGTGNDVAAALRRGAGHVDAVEIDPAIVRAGRLHHPERPYDDPRVAVVVDDARNFLRGGRGGYDLIVYGLLDSHTLLSHASSVRLDSFVYTVEGLRDARERLAPGGVVSLSFSMLSPELGRKLYLMMEEAFGAAPVCVVTRYDRSVLFAQSREGDLRLDPALLGGTDFEDRSTLFASRALDADVSTDDWPFFYMPRRVYPFSYLGMLALVAGLAGWLVRGFVPERPRRGQLPFFFMGAGFMLVETKAITELGLTFGNTWQVAGVVIAAVLGMAYLANLAVERLGARAPSAPTALALVLAALGLGLGFSYAGGYPATPAGKWAAVAVLTCPLFFSGVAFSSLLARTGEVSGALALNLFGALCGGLLECRSMYFGFRFLC